MGAGLPTQLPRDRGIARSSIPTWFSSRLASTGTRTWACTGFDATDHRFEATPGVITRDSMQQGRPVGLLQPQRGGQPGVGRHHGAMRMLSMCKKREQQCVWRVQQKDHATAQTRSGITLSILRPCGLVELAALAFACSFSDWLCSLSALKWHVSGARRLLVLAPCDRRRDG